MHWFLDPIKYHYADFSGRASRKEYWMFTLVSALIMFGLVFISILGSYVHQNVSLAGSFVLVLFMLGIIIPGLALYVRRLHDTGHSGWWYFVGFVPFVGGFVLFIFSVLPSEKGTNAYGANPYEDSAPQTPVATPTVAADAPPAQSA